MLKNLLVPLKDIMPLSTTSMASFNYSQFHLPFFAKQGIRCFCWSCFSRLFRWYVLLVLNWIKWDVIGMCHMSWLIQ